MKVVLTSFRDSVIWDGEKFSIARWQPKGFDYPAMSFLAPYDPDSHRKMVHLEPDVFREMYERLLVKNSFEINMVLGHRGDEQIVLCCWCRPDRQKQYEKLYCHSILVGYYLEEHIDGVECVYADGRDKPLWDRLENDF